MKFKDFINETTNNEVIKDAIKLELPHINQEYIKEIVMNNISLLEYSISLQKSKVLADLNNEKEQDILKDLLSKLRKWINLLHSRWPETKDDKQDSNLSPKGVKPVNAPIDPSKPQTIDVQKELLGLDDKEDNKDNSEDE